MVTVFVPSFSFYFLYLEQKKRGGKGEKRGGGGGKGGKDIDGGKWGFCYFTPYNFNLLSSPVYTGRRRRGGGGEEGGKKGGGERDVMYVQNEKICHTRCLIFTKAYEGGGEKGGKRKGGRERKGKVRVNLLGPYLFCASSTSGHIRKGGGEREGKRGQRGEEKREKEKRGEKKHKINFS